MDFKSLGKTLLATVAPTVAGALGGPGASLAVNGLEKIFGFTPGQSVPEQLSDAIAGATPEQQMQLKEMELNFRLESLKTEYADTASARSMAVATKDNTQRILAYLIVAMTCLGEGYMLVHGAPVGIDQVVLGRILGTLDAALTLVLAFYFGATHSSNK